MKLKTKKNTAVATSARFSIFLGQQRPEAPNCFDKVRVQYAAVLSDETSQSINTFITFSKKDNVFIGDGYFVCLLARLRK